MQDVQHVRQDPSPLSNELYSLLSKVLSFYAPYCPCCPAIDLACRPRFSHLDLVKVLTKPPL